jgi:carbamate kinase
MKKILIAFGGNALLRNGDDSTFESQLERATEAFERISDVILENNVIITHGNGPQVGNILLQNEFSQKVTKAMPLHACGAMSQGLIGEILAEAYDSVRLRKGIMKDASVILTRTVVDPDDKAFQNPSKPIGPYYDRMTAEGLMKTRNWQMKEEGNKGYRRLVPSPVPIDIVERSAIFNCLNDGFMPICTGGGGVPVIKSQRGFMGTDAVIDKDLASSLLARILEVDKFVILTDVKGVYRNYGTPEEELIPEIKVSELEKDLDSGIFPKGSMGPKVRAAIEFARASGKEAVIGSLDEAGKVIDGKSGTVIH